MEIRNMVLRNILNIVFFTCTIAVTKVFCSTDCSDSTFKYWEQYTELEKKEILNNEVISKSAIAYYKSELKIRDNDLSMHLLDTLTSDPRNKKIKTFYFYLFNKICSSSDAAVSEMLGKYCVKMVLNSPEYVFNYFCDHKVTLEKYAKFIGYEMYFKEEGTSTLEYNYTEFKKLVKQNVNKDKYNNVISLLYMRINESMKKMD